MNDIFLISITLLSGLLVIYHHFGYPLILRLFHKQHPQHTQQTRQRHYTNSAQDSLLPSIAIVIPAYNEEQWIAEKIRNLAALDYPSRRLQVIIGCDGTWNDTDNGSW